MLGIPLSLGLRSVGSGLMVPLIAIAVIALCSFGIYVIGTIKTAGASEAEFSRLSEEFEREHKRGKFLEQQVLKSTERIQQYEQDLAEMKSQTKKRIQVIESLPKLENKNESEIVICPIDCIIPEIPEITE